MKRFPLLLDCDLWGAVFRIFYPPAGSTNAEMLPLWAVGLRFRVFWPHAYEQKMVPRRFDHNSTKLVVRSNPQYWHFVLTSHMTKKPAKTHSLLIWKYGNLRLWLRFDLLTCLLQKVFNFLSVVESWGFSCLDSFRVNVSNSKSAKNSSEAIRHF